MTQRLPVMLRALPLCTAMAAASWALPAAAQDPAPAQGRGKRFRLHADTEFFGFTHVDDEAGTPRNDLNIVGFGIGRPTLLDSGACAGLLGACFLAVRPVWGLGFGYAFAQQRAVVGARFAFTVDGVFDDDDDHDSTTLVAGMFVPYFRWIFLPGRAFRPYVEGRFGLGGGALVTEDDDDTKTTINTIYPTVGFGGGLHIFVIDAFSVDLGLNFDYAAPHSRLSTEVMGVEIEEDYEHDANVINFATLLGFSVWFD